MKLVFLYGPPAAGKLTVASELAKMTGFKLLDNHRATDFLENLFPRSDKQLHPFRSRLGRKIRLDIFEAAAQADLDVITTFAPLSPGMYDFIRDVQQAVTRNGGTVCLVQLLPSQDVLEERIVSESRRNVKIDTVARFHELVDGNEGAFATFPDIEHLVLDNSALSPAAAAQQIINHYYLKSPTSQNQTS